MIDTALARLREPRLGMVFVSGIVALLMAAHWPPMAVPAIALLGLAVVRPRIAVRPVVLWAMAATWLAAILLAPERMEDHVPLFTVWLVALAVSLGRDDDGDFVSGAAWQARVLLGVTFGAAVAWKLCFGTYVNGVTLWTFMLVDKRFQPLATVVGLSDSTMEQQRIGLSALLAGTQESVALEASNTVAWAITATAVLTLLLEAIIAVAYLLPDSSRLAVMRLPAIALFGLVVHGVVPVVPFSALLALLAMTVARWRREAMWLLPVLMVVSVTRLMFLTL